MNREILLVEDDELFAESIVDFLEDEGYVVDLATSGEVAIEKSFAKNYDLFLFDINLPGINGIELLTSLRGGNNQTPTIFLTSYKDEETLKKCFISGCDDFLRKPVNIEELSLRINAIMKRTSKIDKLFEFDEGVFYDFEKRAIFRDKEEIRLPLKAMMLLELFIQRNNSLIRQEDIVSHLWSVGEEASEGSLRIYISKLRDIVGKERIKNIKKIGYEVKL